MMTTLPPFALHDFHVHVGEKIAGINLRDGWADLARIPKLGGIGAFCTEEADISLVAKLDAMRAEAARYFPAKVFWHLSPIKTPPSELLPLMGPDTDIKLYTTYKAAGLYRSYSQIKELMLELSDLKPRIIVHCEDEEVLQASGADQPYRSAFDHALRRPELAELKAVERILDLAVRQDYPVHIVHVSSPASALLIRQAKAHNRRISCETGPQYLFMNQERLKAQDGNRWLCSPPLRPESSRGELLELLQDGCFDIIATDHCAFSTDDKDRFRDRPHLVPCGIAGLDSLWQVLDRELVQSGKLSLEKLQGLISVNPAIMMNQFVEETNNV